MIEEIKNWWAERQAKAQQQRKEHIVEEVNEEYNVTERNGNLYLMVGNRAAVKIEGQTTVTEVISMIKKARNAQIDFKKNEI